MSLEPKKPSESFIDIIIDRKSRYAASYAKTASKAEVDAYLKELKKDAYFAKATHNTFAYRIKESSGAIIEGKNDDGETGAGMCILRELQRANFIGGVVVVTRIFGGIHLQVDRFKNVINATKMLLEKIED